MSMNILFLVLLLLFLSSNAGNARISRVLLKEPTNNHLSSKEIDSKLDGNSNIPMQRVTEKSSVPNQVAAAQNESFLEIEKESVGVGNVEQMRRKEGEAIKVSSASVSWRLTHKKSSEFEKPVFFSDYHTPCRS